MVNVARTLFWLFLVLLIGVSPLQSAEELRLIHAERLRNMQKDGEEIQRLEENVHFRRGDYDMFCDNAIRYADRDIAIFWGNVLVYGEGDSLRADSLTVYNQRDLLVARGDARLMSGGRELTARRIRYDTERDVAQATGAVRMREDDREVSADSVWYNEETDLAEIYGSADNPASVYDQSRQIRIHGPVITQYLDSQQLRAPSRPVLVKLDSLGDEIIQITSDFITGNADSGRYVAQDSVIITRDSLRAVTELATFHEEENYAVLEESPVVFYTDHTIRGKSIRLDFKGDQLQRVYIPSESLLRSKTSGWVRTPPVRQTDTTGTAPVDTLGRRRFQQITKENVLRGTQLHMWLEQNAIRRIRVTGMATSTYHVFEDSVYQGINETSGDTIRMQFTENADTLETIDVIGGTRGTFQPHASNASVDTTIHYESDRIHFEVPERITHLQYDARAAYKDMELEAAFIDVFWNQNLLVATPLPDSLAGGSEQRNLPTFRQEGREPMIGDRLEYDLRTRRGRVVHGETKFQDGRYTGEEIMKRGEETFYVSSGVYTTCDLEDPHYHFQSRQMKLILHDKVIARPIIMYIHNVPVFGLPFGLFPQQTGGRASGYILPTYGESAQSGRYLRGLGYYWAASEYWDYRVLFDFWEDRGISLRQRVRYEKRYQFSGNVEFDFDKQFFTETREENYQIRVNHNQTIDPTMNLRVNGSFVSSREFLRETSIERRDRLQQQARSNATFSKNWPNTKNSMSVNLHRTENLQNGNTDMVLPRISFRHGSDKLLRPPQSAGYRERNRWYYNLNYSYNANFRNTVDKTLREDSTYVDPYGRRVDLGQDSTYVTETRQAIQHSFSLQSPLNVLKFFSLNPRVNFSEDWVPSYREPVVRGDTVVTDSVTGAPVFRKVDRFRARHTFNFSLGLNTSLYGLVNIPVGPIRALRHVMKPSVSYSISPDFSKQFYGYYFHGRDGEGNAVKYDRFQGTLAGGTPASQRQSLNISLGNVFQAKYLSGSGEEQEEKKVDFLNWDLNTGYNFRDPDAPWDPIRSTVRTSLGRQLNLNVNMTHDPYKYNSTELTIPRLTRISFSTGFSISGNSFRPREDTSAAVTLPVDTAQTETSLFDDEEEARIDESLFPSRVQQFATGDQLWSMRFNLNYSVDRQNPTIEPDPTFWINTSGSLNLTENWAVSVNSRFDMANRKLVSADFDIKRDLHCWEMVFRWTPSGFGQGYYLRINVKSPNLQDIKVESRGGRQNRFGYY